MQIDFTPHKIKEAKTYIENLVDKEISIINEIKKKNKTSLFKKFFKLLTKPFNISS